MALKITKTLVDDLDKTSPAVATVRFSFNGVDYSIDLNEDHLAEFEAALAPYVGVADRVGGKRPTRRAAAPASASKNAAVREWARAKGHQVADRGRVPAEIVRAYAEANA